jgi:hypothetical protein
VENIGKVNQNKKAGLKFNSTKFKLGLMTVQVDKKIPFEINGAGCLKICFGKTHEVFTSLFLFFI